MQDEVYFKCMVSKALRNRKKGLKMETNKEIIEMAKALCKKFINKVETGKTKNIKTYAKCKALLEVIREKEKALRKLEMYKETGNRAYLDKAMDVLK